MESNRGDRRDTETTVIYVSREFFDMIKSGTKTLELRVAFPSFAKLTPGNRVNFSSGSGEQIEVRILAIRNYKTIDDVKTSEDLSRLAPGMTERQLTSAAKRIFKESDIQKHGLLMIEFAKMA